MQTITIDVKDDFVPIFLSIVDRFKDNITIQNSSSDFYFSQRQSQLEKLRDDVKNGKMEMIEHDDFWNEMDKYLQSLQK